MANVQKIVVKTSGAEKSAGSIKKVDRSIMGLTSSALAYTAAATAIVGIAKKTIDAYGVQEKAERKLASALGHTNKGLLAQASALQQVSSHGDEAIIAVQALISNMGIAEGDIGNATKMAIGLSEALGVDLNMAAKAAAGAIQGDTNMLTRYIPLLKTTKDETEKLAIVQEVANKGLIQARDAAETMSGSMEQAGMAVGDAAEALGGLLAPTVTAVAGGVQFLAEGLSNTVKGLQGIKLIAQEFDLLTVSETQSAEQLAKFKETISGQGIPALNAQAEAIQKSIAGNFAWSDSSQLAQDKLRAINDELVKHDETVSKTAVRVRDFPWLEVTEMAQTQGDVINDLRTDYEKLGGAALESGLKGLAMSQNLGDASRALANQYIVEGVFGAVKGALTSLPFPANILAAGAAGIAANALFNSIVPAKAAATGADFVTNGPELLLVGDNPGGRESVQVTPMGSPNINGPQGGVTINISGDFIGTDDFVETKLIPSINRAVNQGRANIA